MREWREKVARALWKQQCDHWGRYKEKIPELCDWNDLTVSRQAELLREADAAITELLPLMKAEMAKVARGYADRALNPANEIAAAIEAWEPLA